MRCIYEERICADTYITDVYTQSDMSPWWRIIRTYRSSYIHHIHHRCMYEEWYVTYTKSHHIYALRIYIAYMSWCNTLQHEISYIRLFVSLYQDKLWHWIYVYDICHIYQERYVAEQMYIRRAICHIAYMCVYMCVNFVYTSQMYIRRAICTYDASSGSHGNTLQHTHWNTLQHTHSTHRTTCQLQRNVYRRCCSGCVAVSPQGSRHHLPITRDLYAHLQYA